MRLKIAQLIALVFFFLVGGVFWGTWFSLSRSISALSAPTFLEIGRAIIANLGGPMRIHMPGAIIAALATLVLFPNKRCVAFYCTLLGAALMMAALLITLSVNVPIDNQIKTWTATSLPANWADVRERWEAYHTARTFVSIGAFVLLLAGSLISPTRLSRP
jgi:hypothetical protein